MKSIQDLIRQKELELQQALEDAVRAKELELVRVRKTLQEAVTALDRLLEAEAESAGINPAQLSRPFAGARDGARAAKSNGPNGGSDLP
jgi:hypothetical protein